MTLAVTNRGHARRGPAVELQEVVTDPLFRGPDGHRGFAYIYLGGHVNERHCLSFHHSLQRRAKAELHAQAKPGCCTIVCFSLERKRGLRQDAGEGHKRHGAFVKMSRTAINTFTTRLQYASQRSLNRALCEVTHCSTLLVKATMHMYFD
ncbi:hypothetical protein BC835DRAFT_1528752 [Cytidiella melzeri]|nr:hypothetical protein BC835DRAFT_1528752 [Cytidiella melzeri]